MSKTLVRLSYLSVRNSNRFFFVYSKRIKNLRYYVTVVSEVTRECTKRTDLKVQIGSSTSDTS